MYIDDISWLPYLEGNWRDHEYTEKINYDTFQIILNILKSNDDKLHLDFSFRDSGMARFTKINNQKHYEIAKKKLETNFSRIIKDVSRYIPCMEKAKYIDSIFEIKTLLPRNENDDGRPILFKKDVGNVKNLVCIMGGKLDNIYDLEDKLWSVVWKKIKK